MKRKVSIFFSIAGGILLAGWIGESFSILTFGQQVPAPPNQRPRRLPDDWAEKLFDRKTYDFGRVPAGARAEFEFTITNIYPFEVEISRVRETCECTRPMLGKLVLGPGEQTALTAQLQTHRFKGRKGATLTVTFIRPEFAEVRLHVTSYIDPGISLQPPEIDFGILRPDESAQKQVEISCRGRPNWRIEAVRTARPNISAHLAEWERNAQGVRYRLQVQWMPSSLMGPFKEAVYLKTNDPDGAELVLLVTGRVAGPVEVSPAVVWLGVLAPGSSTAKVVVVRAQQPFRIEQLTSSLPELSIAVATNAAGAQSLHRLLLRYRAPLKLGKHTGILRLQTDRSPAALEIPVQVLVLPAGEN